MKDKMTAKHYRLANSELFGEATLNGYVMTGYSDGKWFSTFVKTGLAYRRSDNFASIAEEKIKSGEWEEVKLVPQTGYDVMTID